MDELMAENWGLFLAGYGIISYMLGYYLGSLGRKQHLKHYYERVCSLIGHCKGCVNTVAPKCCTCGGRPTTLKDEEMDNDSIDPINKSFPDPTEYPESVPGELGVLPMEELIEMGLKRIAADWNLVQTHWKSEDPRESGLAILAAASAETGFEYLYEVLKIKHQADHGIIAASEYMKLIIQTKEEYDRIMDESGVGLIGNIGEAYAKKAAEGG